MRWVRDFYNFGITHLPSRRMRRWWLNRLRVDAASSAFFGMGIQLFDPWQVSVGQRVAINGKCILDGRGGKIIIGDDTDIGQQTHIWTLSHDPNCPQHGTTGSSVVIEDHVWIATRVTILPGVRIGRGAVVGAGSVVTRNVGECEIVAGAPAKLIGRRDNPLTYELSYRPRFR